MIKHFRFQAIVFYCAILLNIPTLFAQPSIPVDPYTGKAQITIPIWSPAVPGIQAPIFLSYNSGGVKVEEIESNAGVSWTLVAGGQISRELRGLPDDLDMTSESRKGWLWTGYTNTFTLSTEQSNWTSLNSYYANLRDTEPDLFNISAPGLSGQFVFDNNRILQVIPYQDIKIDPVKDGNNRFIAFTITTNIGTKYFFNLTEQTSRQALQNGTTAVTHFKKDYAYYGTKLTYFQSWKLTKIQTATGQSISFSYEPNAKSISTKKIQIAINNTLSNNTTGPLTHLYSVTDELETVKLSGITYGGFNVNFEWNANLISAIEVKSFSESQVRKFSFLYREIRQIGDAAGSSNQKNFLKEIKEEIDCAPFPSHSFEYYAVDFTYNDTTIPFKDKDKQDYWGYFNSTASSLIPKVYVNESATHGERFRIDSLSGYTALSGGAIRKVNPTAVVYGSLGKVTYPSGGFAKLIFEAGEYNDFGVTALGGGIRVRSIEIDDGDTDVTDNIITNYEYKLANGQSSGRMLYNPIFAFADGNSYILVTENLAPDNNVYYERTTVKQTGKGKTVYEYHLPGVYPDKTLLSPYTDFAATESKIAKNGSPFIGNLEYGYYTFPAAPSTNYYFEQGLLNKVSDFAEGGTLPLKEKIFTYKRLLTTPVVITATKFDQHNANIFMFGQYKILANLAKLVETEESKTYDPANLSSFISDLITYTYNGSFMLSEIAKTNSNGHIYKTKFKYAKDFSSITNVNTAAPDSVKVKHSLSLKRMNDPLYRMHGTVIEETNTLTKSGVESFLSSTLTLYSDFATSTRVLPSKSMTYTGEAGFAVANVVVNGSFQEFNFSTKYRDNLFFNAYDGNGNVISYSNSNRSISSTHLGFNNSLPVVSITNAKPDEVIFSNFDTYTSYQLSPPYTTSLDSYSGGNSVSMSSSALLNRDNVTNTVPGGFYRFTCRAKATTASNISIYAKVYNGTGWVSTTITYPASASGKWTFLEGRVSMSGIPAVFNFQVGASANILLDDIAFYPEKAEINYMGYKPIYGATSVSDTRGNTQFTEYDQLGRVKYVLNSDKEVVQVKEYKFKTVPAVALKSDYTLTPSSTTVSVNAIITFTAPDNCGMPVNYEWKVDGSVVGGNTATHNYAFTSVGAHNVELTVSSPGYEPSKTKYQFNVTPQPLSVTMTILPATPPEVTNTIKYCDNGGNARTFSVSASGCITTGLTTYFWYYKTANDSDFVLAASYSTAQNYTFRYSDVGIGWENRVNFEVMCVVVSSCNISGTIYSSSGSSGSAFVAYDSNSTHNCL